LTYDGKSQNADLTLAGDVFGNPTVNGTVKSVFLSPTGFFGSYSVSPII